VYKFQKSPQVNLLNVMLGQALCCQSLSDFSLASLLNVDGEKKTQSESFLTIYDNSFSLI